MGTPERQRKSEVLSSGKAVKLHNYSWFSHRTNNCATANTKWEQINCFYGPTRGRGRCGTARGGRQGTSAVLALENSSPIKLWAGYQLLTMSSWDPGWFISAQSVRAWDQVPWGDAWPMQPLQRIWEPEQLGPGKCTRCMVYPGLFPCWTPGRDCSLAVHLEAWPSWTWEVHKTGAGYTREPEWLWPVKHTRHMAHLRSWVCALMEQPGA